MSQLTDKIMKESLDNIQDDPEEERRRKVDPYAMVQEQDNKYNSISQPTQTQIVEDFIKRLLAIDEEEDEFDPNALDPPPSVHENKFIGGIKKPQEPTPLKSASRPPMVSEVESMTDTTGCYYIQVDKLKRWIEHFIEKGRVRLTANGNGITVEIKISKELLLANFVKKKE